MLTAFNGRFTDGFFDELADDVQFSFELRLVQHVAGDEHLAHEGFGFPGLDADRIAFDRHVTPAEQSCAFLLDDLAEQCFALLARRRTWREKHLTYAVFAGARQFDAGSPRRASQKFMRHLQENPRAVPRTRVTPL